MIQRVVGGTSRGGRGAPRFLLSILASALLSFGLLACGDKNPQNEAPAEKTPTPAPSSIEVKKVDEAGIAAAVRQHRGKVVLLDIWATWCGPCVEEFPRLARWVEKYGADRLAVITVSLDDPSQIESKVVPFLTKQKTAALDLLLYTGGDHDKMVNSIDPNWAGEVPALFLYDRAGKLAASLPGEHEAAEVESHIERLLADSGR